MMIRTIIPAMLMLTALAVGCAGQKEIPAEPATVWMETDPIQCLENPWEKEWISKPGRSYSDYPIGDTRMVEEPEAAIIKDFFERQGVKVYELKSKPYPEDMAVCDACTCPAGYTLYLRVALGKSELLTAFNFKETKMR